MTPEILFVSFITYLMESNQWKLSVATILIVIRQCGTVVLIFFLIKKKSTIEN